jgi:hypothetical protein
MKDGDVAGFAAFNDRTCAWAVKKQGRKWVLELDEWEVKLTQREKAVEGFDEKTIDRVELKSPIVWLRIDGDFRPGKGDKATFFYSTDGNEWTQKGGEYHMRFDWQRFFMGTKFGIFNYATKRLGGWIDVDSFDYNVTEK